MGLSRLLNWGATSSGLVEPENYAAARERYEEICAELGIHRAPTLRLAKKVTMLSKIVIGDWLVRKSIRAAAYRVVPSDHFFLHELAHFVCLKYGGYHGYHGAPFLALVQLLYDFYWEGDIPDAITATVEGDWPRYVGPDFRAREMAEARAAVETVKASLAAQRVDLPGADLLAKEVGKCFPDRTPGRRHRFSREMVVDMTNTQRDGLFTLLLWEGACVALLLGTVFHFWSNAVTAWLAVIAVLLVVGTIAVVAATDMSRRFARLWRRVTARFSRSERERYRPTQPNKP